MEWSLLVQGSSFDGGHSSFCWHSYPLTIQWHSREYDSLPGAKHLVPGKRLYSRPDNYLAESVAKQFYYYPVIICPSKVDWSGDACEGTSQSSSELVDCRWRRMATTLFLYPPVIIRPSRVDPFIWILGEETSRASRFPGSTFSGIWWPTVTSQLLYPPVIVRPSRVDLFARYSRRNFLKHRVFWVLSQWRLMTNYRHHACVTHQSSSVHRWSVCFETMIVKFLHEYRLKTDEPSVASDDQLSPPSLYIPVHHPSIEERSFIEILVKIFLEQPWQEAVSLWLLMVATLFINPESSIVHRELILLLDTREGILCNRLAGYYRSVHFLSLLIPCPPQPCYAKRTCFWTRSRVISLKCSEELRNRSSLRHARKYWASLLAISYQSLTSIWIFSRILCCFFGSEWECKIRFCDALIPDIESRATIVFDVWFLTSDICSCPIGQSRS